VRSTKSSPAFAAVLPMAAMFLATLAVHWLATPAMAEADNADASLPADRTSPPQTGDALEMAERVDELLVQRWSAAKIQPAEAASDSEFLRRVCLDLIGVVPTVAETRRFLDSDGENKRQELIDQLLASPRHATHLANTWRNILMPDGFATEMANGAAGMQAWLRGRFQQNMRYDRLVGDFLTATGSAESGPALYYQALNSEPQKLAASTARIFLGMQLECAQCHDHPFDEWSQADFWGYAAFFAQVEGSNRGAQFFLSDSRQGEVMLPEMDEVVPPKFPSGDTPGEDKNGTRRLQLSIWMSSPNNPFLARATVNRVWSLMFGRGLVNPVDDLGPENEPIHPEVLDELSVFFVQSGYNIRDLFRLLANTDAYQTTSQIGASKESQQQREQFAQMGTKALTAEQLFDSIQRCLHLPVSDLNSSNYVESQQRQQFVSQIDAKTRDATEYGGGIQQTLNLMNGPRLATATNQSNVGILAAIQAPFLSREEKLETLFLASLSRMPSPKEQELFAPSGEKVDYGDLLWAILNSAEFRFNH